MHNNDERRGVKRTCYYVVGVLALFVSFLFLAVVRTTFEMCIIYLENIL